MTNKLIFGTVLAMMASLGQTVHAETSAPPAPLPDLMDQQQLAKWNSGQQVAADTAAAAQVGSEQFYTGKPYVADAGGYVYKYRTYSPEMSRWTSADPSGFPDGINNFVYARNQASYSLDDNGLATLAPGSDTSNSSTWAVTDSWSGGSGSVDEMFSAADAGAGVSGAGTDFPGTIRNSSGGYTPYATQGFTGTIGYSVSGGVNSASGGAPVFSGTSGTTTISSNPNQVVGMTVVFTPSTFTGTSGLTLLQVVTTITLFADVEVNYIGIPYLSTQTSPAITLTDIYE